jgi:choline dehydrogenase
VTNRAAGFLVGLCLLILAAGFGSDAPLPALICGVAAVLYAVGGLVTPRGRVVGGSSSINGMVYVRGHARDYDTWDGMGAQGWAYADVLPYFQRMEHWHGAADAGTDTAYRGTNGPLHITRGPRKNPLFEAFIEAGRQAGYPVTPDYNGAQQEGFGAMEATIYQGERWSAAKAYLRPAIATGRVRLIRASATKIQALMRRCLGGHRPAVPP